MKPSKHVMLAICSYLAEVLLAGLIYSILWQVGWLNKAGAFLESSAGSWAVVFGIMLTSALAARLIFFTLNNGDFGAWLEWKKVGGIYSGAFMFAVLLFLSVTITAILLIYVKNTWFTKFGIFIVTFGLINSVTFSILIYRLTRLQSLFNFELKKVTEAEKSSQ